MYEVLRNITAFNPNYGFSLQHVIMLCFALSLAYIAIGKKKEPYLLLPLSFGMLLANLPGAFLSAYDADQGGLLYYIYKGIRPASVSSPIFPPLIFLCLGVMTDFSPLISNPRTLLISIGGQLGIFIAFGGALFLSKYIGEPLGWFHFGLREAASIGIIGGADGPTSIYTATKLSPDILSAVAIAAFSYMGLVPFIQPPIMRLLITKKERLIKMTTTKTVSQRTKILFPFWVTIASALIVPASTTLIGMLMLGNLIKESKVADRFLDTLTMHFLNLLTIFVSFAIGSSATAQFFLQPGTICILILGLISFVFSTIGGVLSAKLLNVMTGGKVNPLIGNAGVSAMPMAARISQKMGQDYDKQNHLLMHAMGPLVGAVLASAIVAGIFISVLQ